MRSWRGGDSYTERRETSSWQRWHRRQYIVPPIDWPAVALDVLFILTAPAHPPLHCRDLLPFLSALNPQEPNR